MTEVAALRNVVSPAPRVIWQAVFDQDDEAVPYQSPQWTDALCRSAHRRDRSRLYTFDDGVQMVLPLVARGAHRVARMVHAIDLDGGFDTVWHNRL